MLNPIPTIFPTISGPRRGRVLALWENAPAVVLIDRAQGSRDISGTLTELSYYLQDAGLSVLQLAMPDPEQDASDWASTLFGVVSLVRSLGAPRVALMQATRDIAEHAPRDPVESIVALVELTTRDAAPDDIAAAVVRLTAAIRLVAESVVGMATVVTPVASGRTRCRPQMASATHRLAYSTNYPIFTLGDGENAGPLVGQLYGWAMRLTRDTSVENQRAGACSVARPPDGLRLRPSATWNDHSEWLTERWGELLNSLDRRAPELARRARAAGVAASSCTDRRWLVIHQARAAWRHLDEQARRDWLNFCSLAFAAMSGANTLDIHSAMH